jgi:hypothetical protein
MSLAANQRGFSVRVFLPNGDPDGVKVVEKSNWTGCGLVIPRALFGEAKLRPEVNRTGVYLLVGPSESGALPQAYIGEGDPVRPRLEQHAKQKDFWTHAVIFTSKDQNLNKAHVQRLESRLVELAKSSKRCTLENANQPQPPSLSEADTAEVEGFLDDLLLCLPVLGYGFFETAPPKESGAVPLFVKAKGIEARGYESPKGFVVRAGSQAVRDEKQAASTPTSVRDMRAELAKQGVLVEKGIAYELSQDYTFSSPSMAAAVLLGRSANGRIEWKTVKGKTLKSIQDAELGA